MRIRAVKTEQKNVLFRVVWAGRRISTWEYAEKVAHLDVILYLLTNARKTGGRSTPESRRTAEYASNVINTIKNLTSKYEEAFTDCPICLEPINIPFCFLRTDESACGGSAAAHTACIECVFRLEDDSTCPIRRANGEFQHLDFFIGKE